MSWLTLDEVETACAGVEPAFVDVTTPDANGVLRGKRMRYAEFLKVVERGMPLALSLFAINAEGHCVNETGIIWETGDPDAPFRPVEGGFALLPAAQGEAPRALSILKPTEPCGYSPFEPLERARARLAGKGLTAVVAPEIEFYLTRPPADAGPADIVPPELPSAARRPSLYAFDMLDRFQPIFDDLYAAAERAGVRAGAVLSEAGPGQFEVNLHHVDDVEAACVDVLRLRTLIRACARAHGLDATYMAKPYDDASGSGFHVHASLLNEEGSNVLAEKDDQRLRHAIAGLVETGPDFMVLFAPTPNAFRRFRPKQYVPLTLAWGRNNRMTALRVPESGTRDRRVEHRIASADANPFLVVAAVLSGMAEGLDAAREPQPETRGEAGGEDDHAPLLMTTWQQALDRFDESAVANAALGGTFHRLYAAIKRDEFESFDRIVTEAEHRWYGRLI